MNQKNSKGMIKRLVRLVTGKDEPQNRQELIEILQEASNNKLVKPDTLHIIKGAIEVTELRVEDIMVPKSQMIILEAKKPLPELLSVIIESGHSRFPVIGENSDDYHGLLLAKDLLRYYIQHEHDPFYIEKILRPIVTVPESKRLDLLLKELRVNHTHIALVADEHGNTAGLITIEDVIEQIVGDIEDEYDLEDDEPDQIRKATKQQYLVDALTPIESFNTYFKSSISEADFDTIGGIITHQIGHVPKRSETCIINDFKFTISKADERRVLQLSCRRLG